MRMTLVVLLTLGLCACGAPGSGTTTAPSSIATPASTASGGAQQLTVQSLDSMRFEPATLVVRASQPVELTLKNAGAIQHDFTLTDGVAQPVKIQASAGQSGSATFTLDQPGTYTFTCSQPGHAAAGMQGTITAQ